MLLCTFVATLITNMKLSNAFLAPMRRLSPIFSNRRSALWAPVVCRYSNSVAQDISNPKVNYFDIDPSTKFGDYDIIASQQWIKREFVDATSLNESSVGRNVWLRGRVSNVRAKGNVCFLVLRCDVFATIQVCHFKDKSSIETSKKLIKFMESLPLESIVDIYGSVQSANVISCTQNAVEINAQKCFVVSRCTPQLPFLLEDAARKQVDVDMSQDSSRPFPNVPQDLRLNNRWLDLRVPAHNAVMRIRSGVSLLFREFLDSKDFTEINTPKILPGESEGGSDVFKLNYFGRSPQLYKQMAISADLKRVFEIGPVFRAESSHTRRHLCEFTGLDIEMEIQEHYREALEVIHNMFRHIFDGLERKYAKELAVIRQQYPSEPVKFSAQPLIINWQDGIQMLRKAGLEVGDFEDLSTNTELQLGQLVKKEFDVDFFILDQYPSSIRPFYTMPSSVDSRYSNSYDMFIRGQEICSGAQRCHLPEMLEQRILAKGLSLDTLGSYVDSFRHGMSPHAGAGIGLERVVFLYLGLDNVRKASMFPRDPNRLEP